MRNCFELQLKIYCKGHKLVIVNFQANDPCTIYATICYDVLLCLPMEPFHKIWLSCIIRFPCDWYQFHNINLSHNVVSFSLPSHIRLSTINRIACFYFARQSITNHDIFLALILGSFTPFSILVDLKMLLYPLGCNVFGPSMGVLYVIIMCFTWMPSCSN